MIDIFKRKDKKDNNTNKGMYTNNIDYCEYNDDNEKEEYEDRDCELLTNDEIINAIYIHTKSYIENYLSDKDINIIEDENLMKKFYEHLIETFAMVEFNELTLNKNYIVLDMEDNNEEETYDKDDLPSYNELIRLGRVRAKYKKIDCNSTLCDKCPIKEDCSSEGEICLADSIYAILVLVKFNKTGTIKPIVVYSDSDDEELEEQLLFINEFRLFQRELNNINNIYNA